MAMEIVIASKNSHKVQEFQALFGQYGLSVRGLAPDIPDCPEHGHSFEANAVEKAVFYAAYCSGWIVADDSGLEVEALSGEPGIRSARYAGAHGDDAANRQLLRHKLSVLGPSAPRQGRFVCTLAAWHAGFQQGIVVRGELRGEVVLEERGEHGFGYDAMFLLPELGRTMAELSPHEKNRWSHRAIAVTRLMANQDAWLRLKEA
ncbi:MAG: non-canonical purine NTP pyrophosphatase [Alicyclobacillus sp.]|nr:non-canonical purine NTP pyrophosphatase [Alicyclobacillus sp.]